MIDLHRLPNPVRDEKVIHVLRRHPITLFAWFLGVIFTLLGPFIVWAIIAYGNPLIL